MSSVGELFAVRPGTFRFLGDLVLGFNLAFAAYSPNRLQIDFFKALGNSVGSGEVLISRELVWDCNTSHTCAFGGLNAVLGVLYH